MNTEKIVDVVLIILGLIIVFLSLLKLKGILNISWIFIFAPIYIPFALVIVMLMIAHIYTHIKLEWPIWKEFDEKK